MALSFAATASGAAEARRARERTIAIAAAAAGIVLGVAAASLVFGSPIALVAILGVAVAVTVWTAPWTGAIGMALIATTIEQFSLVAEGTVSDGTDKLPIFASLNAIGVRGIYASPYELFLALVITVWVVKGFARRNLGLSTSVLGLSVLGFAAIVLIGWVRGVVGGGSLQDALLELRPWLYLTIAFVASTQLITTRKQLSVLLGAMVTGISIKGIQGVVTLGTHFTVRSTQAILAHEESFFFGVFIALVAALWLIPVKSRIRTFMTALLPFVLVADIANQRRTAWAIASVALVTVFVICFLAIPERRKAIAGLAAVGALLSVVYWIGFSNDPGLLGQPARAVLSQLSPSSRDQASNQYRVVENVNLGIGIRDSMPLGTGFGHPIRQAVPNVDISNIDSFISYLPHNTVLYVWLRLGLPGIVAFWIMIGVGLMAAVDSFRRRHNDLTAALSVTVIAALMSYMVQGYYDMGLYWFRIAIVMGCLMGALEVARRLDATDRIAVGPEKARSKTGAARAAREVESAA